ncbi:MAG TPA: hypothetical protein VNY05_16625 [Candidatus Acidoferrales bacterium]|nr:hypothetical protein [Candidatus Acidoferrales bacterium]
MQNVTGQVVEGDNFFDRTREMAQLWRGLETDNLLLLAPRRVGKTSVLRRMKADADAHGFTAVFVDVSDCADELRFVQRLYAAILEHHGVGDRLWNGIKESWLGKTVSRVKKAGGAGFSIEFESDDIKWARMGEELADALEPLEWQTLIQVDELPVFALKLLNRPDDTDQGRIREFLYWLRRLRLQYPKIRWMLAGSIGLDTVASRLNIADSINDLRIETLGAFDTPTAHALLQRLAGAYGIELDLAVREHAIARVGWPVPYYLQLIFDKLRECQEPGTEDVDRAVDTLLDPSHKGLFDYWRQRLRDELGRPDAEYAAALLHPASRAAEGVRAAIFKLALTGAIADAGAREDKVRFLLDVLQNDGYLVEEAGRWRFRSPLLREYWRRRVAPPEAGDE